MCVYIYICICVCLPYYIHIYSGAGVPGKLYDCVYVYVCVYVYCSPTGRRACSSQYSGAGVPGEPEQRGDLAGGRQAGEREQRVRAGSPAAAEGQGQRPDSQGEC